MLLLVNIITGDFLCPNKLLCSRVLKTYYHTYTQYVRSMLRACIGVYLPYLFQALTFLTIICANHKSWPRSLV